MRKILMTTVAAMGLAFAGPALAVCEGELAEAEAALDASVTVTDADRAEAAALLAEAEVSLAAGDEAACIEAVTQAQSIVGDDAADTGTGTGDNGTTSDDDDADNGAAQ
jgi:hypothetical protein